MHVKLILNVKIVNVIPNLDGDYSLMEKDNIKMEKMEMFNLKRK